MTRGMLWLGVIFISGRRGENKHINECKNRYYVVHLLEKGSV